LIKEKLTGYFIFETGVEKKGDMSSGVGWLSFELAKELTEIDINRGYLTGTDDHSTH
jgi:hypothetical protein